MKHEITADFLADHDIPLVGHPRHFAPFQTNEQSLWEAYRRVMHAVGRDTTRPNLNSVSIEETDEKQLIMVATDGHRLAWTRITVLPLTMPDMRHGRGLIVFGKDKVPRTRKDWQAAYNASRSELRFPDWRLVVPAKDRYPVHVTVHAPSFASALKLHVLDVYATSHKRAMTAHKKELADRKATRDDAKATYDLERQKEKESPGTKNALLEAAERFRAAKGDYANARASRPAAGDAVCLLLRSNVGRIDRPPTECSLLIRPAEPTLDANGQRQGAGPWLKEVTLASTDVDFGRDRATTTEPIGLNAHYLLDVLSTIDTYCTIHWNSALDPVLIERSNGDGAYVIMPKRV